METYALSPPQMKPTRVPYQVLAPGTEDCQHELLNDSWHERISVQAGVVFITFTCYHCGRRGVSVSGRGIPSRGLERSQAMMMSRCTAEGGPAVSTPPGVTSTW